MTKPYKFRGKVPIDTILLPATRYGAEWLKMRAILRKGYTFEEAKALLDRLLQGKIRSIESIPKKRKRRGK